MVAVARVLSADALLPPTVGDDHRPSRQLQSHGTCIRRIARAREWHRGAVTSACHCVRVSSPQNPSDKPSQLAFQCTRRKGLKVSYLFDKPTNLDGEIGFNVVDAVEGGSPTTTTAAIDLFKRAVVHSGQHWRGSLVLPLVAHDQELSRSHSIPARLGASLAASCEGKLLLDVLHHSPHLSVRTTPVEERDALMANSYSCGRPDLLRSGRVLLVDDSAHSGATAAAAAAALLEAARQRGIELTVELVVLGVCADAIERVNDHVPHDVRELLWHALATDSSLVDPPLDEGAQTAVIYRLLDYGGSTVRATYVRGTSVDSMLKTRGAEHVRAIKAFKHSSPKLQKAFHAHVRQHGEEPQMQLVEQLHSRKGETMPMFRRRVIAREQVLLDKLFDAGIAMNAARMAGRPSGGRGELARVRCIRRERLAAQTTCSAAEEAELAELEASRVADERAWADCLAGKGGGPGRVRCERRVRLAALTMRSDDEEAELAQLEASREADERAWADCLAGKERGAEIGGERSVAAAGTVSTGVTTGGFKSSVPEGQLITPMSERRLSSCSRPQHNGVELRADELRGNDVRAAYSAVRAQRPQCSLPPAHLISQPGMRLIVRHHDDGATDAELADLGALHRHEEKTKGGEVKELAGNALKSRYQQLRKMREEAGLPAPGRVTADGQRAVLMRAEHNATDEELKKLADKNLKEKQTAKGIVSGKITKPKPKKKN